MRNAAKFEVGQKAIYETRPVRVLELLGRTHATVRFEDGGLDAVQTAALRPAPATFQGRYIRHSGGRWWTCTLCGGPLAAHCECCEPPRCNCSLRRNKAVIEGR